MTEPRVLARHLASCRQDGSEPATARADPKLWVLAVEQLVAWNALDEAAWAAPRLRDAFPSLTYFRTMASVLARLPPAPAGSRPIAVEPDRQVEVVALARARTVLFVFTGRYGGLGAPINILHRWFARLDAHLVYLRDALDNAFVDGIPALARDHRGTVAALQAIARDLGADRMACYGNSTGGYAALRYGIDLPAAAVLAFGAPTTLATEAWADRVGNRRRFTPGPDLRPVYESSAAPPRVRVVFGAENETDRGHAERLAGLAGVTLEAVPDWAGHNAFLPMIETGRFAELLAELAGAPGLSDNGRNGAA